MSTLFGMFPFLKTLFADSGYQGPKFAKGLAKVLPYLEIEIVKRSDQVRGFVVLPKRKNASAFRLRFSQSLAKRRQRLSQAMVRSTIQRFGKTTNPLT